MKREETCFNRRTNRITLVILLSFLTLLLCGCWDRIEPDFIGLVTMVAFDLDDERGLLKVYAQLPNPAGAGQQQSNGGGGSNQAMSATWTLEASGYTVFQAIKNMELQSTRRLLFTHVEVVLFSEKLARQGIRPVLDFFEREPQVRLIARPFVVQGDLQKLMESQFPLEQFGATALSKQLASVQEEAAATSDTDSLRVMMHRLTIPGWELDLPRLIVMPEEETKKKGEEKTAKQNPVLLTGLAVFRDDKLVGFFDARETAGCMWLKGAINRHYLVLQCPNGGERLTVEIYEMALQLVPWIDGSKVHFKASIFAEGRLQEFSCQELSLEEAFIASLNRRLATAIRNEASAALDKARELETDVFGLGNLLYRTRNKDWQCFEDKWKEIFPEVMVDLEIEATIRRHGLTLAPIKIR